MATSTLLPPDQDANQRYAPRSNGQISTDQAFKNIVDNYDDTTDHPLGDQETNAVKNTGSSKADSGDLGQLEKTAADDKVGNGFKPGPKKNSKKQFTAAKKSMWNKKKASIAGALTGGVLGGGMLGLSIVAPSAQLVQLSKTLGHGFAKQDHDSSSRIGRLWRYSRALQTNQVERVRLGSIANKVFQAKLEELRSNGITIDKGRIGLPTRTNFDIEKMKTRFPELKGMSEDQAKQFLSDKFKVDVSKISGSGTKFSVDQTTDFSMTEARALTKGTIFSTGDTGLIGKTVSAIEFRVAATAWDNPSLLHPLDRAVAKAKRNALINGKAPAEADKAAQEAEAEKVKTAMEPTTTKGAAALDDIKAKSGFYKSTAMKVLLFTGGVCMIRAIADSVITVNYYQVALPSAETAMHFIAIGEQIEAGGDDVTAEEIGQAVQSLQKSGESIWQTQAMEQLSTGSHHTGDPNITADEQQAFASNTTAKTIKDFASDALGGNAVAGALCSKVGIGVQITAGIILSAATLVGEGASLGTLTPEVVGFWALKEGVGFAVSAVAMHYVEHYILKNTTTALADDAFSGSEGGNLLAYGARQAANVSSVASGGVDLANNGSTLEASQEIQQEQQQFQSQSLFARMFNAYDSQSLLGHFMQDISPSFTQNIATTVGSAVQLSSALPSVLGKFLPHAAAEATDYDWSFGQVGRPDNMLNDPNLDNPYDNGDKVADILTASCLNSDGTVNTSCTYAKDIDACFGDSLSYADGMWDTSYAHEIDTHSQSYQDAPCKEKDMGNIKDTAANNATGKWRRIVTFVGDTAVAKAAACGDGDSTYCAGSTSAASTGGALSTIDQSTMYQDSTNVPCATGTNDLGVYDGYHSGQKVAVRLCTIPGIPSSSAESHNGYGVKGANGLAIVNSRVSANFLDLERRAAAAGVKLSADSSFRSMAHQQALCADDSGCSSGNSYRLVAKPGTSNHQMGLAIDFSIKSVKADSSSCVGRAEAPGDPMWNFLNNGDPSKGIAGAAADGIRQYTNESWHWDTMVDATRCGGDGTT